MTSAVIVSYLTNIIASKLGVEISEIDTKKPFFSIGVSSLIIEEIRTSLAQSYEELSSTSLFEYPSVEKLAKHLSSLQPVTCSEVAQLIESDKIDCRFVDTNESSSHQKKHNTEKRIKRNTHKTKNTKCEASDIAVIGIAGKFPNSSSPTALWENLINKVDCVSSIPSKRWNADQLYKHLERNGLSISGKWGGFVDDIEYFDPLFFQIPHREAEIMDPQQKLFLQCGWELMEDAGYANAERRETSNIGVYVGVTWNEFTSFVRDETLATDSYKGAGSLYWAIPNRLSYFMNLTGPSVAIDTACSSSSVAIHDACKAINSGDCDMAIAGGVNLNLHPAKYQFLTQNHFLASDGRCKSFGDGGDGYVPSEGVAAILLKPLKNAIKDNDQIYGVVKGVATNHGGKVTGYTVPNPVAHTEVIAKAIERAGLEPKDISYIECHGTGTDLGDPIEIAGLSGVFAKEHFQENDCAIGSLKSNIGHLEAAAGVAGLIKVLLAMRENTLPASLHSEVENKKLKLDKTAFKLIKESTPWYDEKYPLRAGISSFGAGGSNAHIVVESYPSERDKKSLHSSTTKNASLSVFVLSVETAHQLQQYSRNVLSFLCAISDGARGTELFRDICFTSLSGRSHFNHRLAIVAVSIDDIISGLKDYLDNSDNRGDGISYSIYKGVVNAKSKKSTHLAGGSNWRRTLQNWSKRWVTGNTLVNELLDNHANNISGKRTSFPTYPFLKERSWLCDGYPLVPIKIARFEQGVIHPLVDRNTSTIFEQSFKKLFDISEFVLKDHLVNEVHVIPGVCHLEMARICGEQTLSENVSELKDVWFSNVISVIDQREVEVRFEIDGEELSYSVWDPLSKTAFSRGKIGSLEADSNHSLPTDDFKSLSDKMIDEWSVDKVYEIFVRTGVIQKESFQVIKRLQFNDALALSMLQLPDGLAGDFSRFGFHPSLIDGIVQTAMMHVQYLSDVEIKILPFHFSSVKLIRPLEQRVYVKSVSVDSSQKQFDLTLYNENGQVLVSVTNFILREMKEDTAREETKRKSIGQQVNSISNYYVPLWQTNVPADKSEWHSKKSDLPIWIIGDAGEYDSQIEIRYSNALLIHNKINAIDVSHEGKNRYDLNLSDWEQIQNLVSELSDKSLLPHAVVFFDDVKVKASAFGGQLFLLTKALITRQQKTNFSVVIRNNEESRIPALRAAEGYFKTLCIEKPGFIGRVMEFEDSSLKISDIIGAILSEFEQSPKTSSIRYLENLKEEKQYVRLSPNELTVDAPVSFRKGGTYLITGGMGGIGLIFAQYILNEYNANVILTGRSDLKHDKLALLKTLNTKGVGNAIYIRCDVVCADDVDVSIKQIIEQFGELNGVIHSAGTIDDAFILRKNLSSFEKVIEPKIDGVLNIDNATKTMNLDFFCLFSSVTAILGNLGQCDYGFGNAFEDAFSVYRNNLVKSGERSGKSLSINWPYWKNGGMQLNNKEEELLTKNFGFSPLENYQGIEALKDALKFLKGNFAILDGDHKKIQRSLGMVSEDSTDTSGSIAKNVIDNDRNDLKVNAALYLKQLFAQELKIPLERIDTKSSFEKYGFDSIIMIDLINIMEKKFRSLPKTLFFEYQTLDQLADYFVTQHPSHFQSSDMKSSDAGEVRATVSSDSSDVNIDSSDKSSGAINKSISYRFLSNTNKSVKKATHQAIYVEHAPLKRQAYSNEIAIVGLAGRYPDADNVEALWENLVLGKDSIREVPKSIWNWKEFYQEGKFQQGKSYGKWGGFLDNVDAFDARYFNISPKEAETMDPQERLFLQTATHAIQDAGYKPDTLGGVIESGDNPVGVFVGVMWGDYQLYGVQSSDTSQWTTPRSFYWAIANRISYFYNFSGPSMAVDSACSSSLSALHLACESLRRGEINAAIAGGVNLTLHPNKYNLLSEMQFLSTDGRCRSFGEGGDGYVPGDGVGAVVLKRLTDAEEDGDHIYAIVRGSSVNHGGKTTGFTVPNPNRQASLIRNALQKSGINPRHVSYVEAHGTGTSLGDPVEMIGLQKAYNQDENSYCAIGSIKSNFGHLEAAAGIAAITKVLLQLKYKQIVPSIHSEVLNSNIDFDNTPFFVQRELTEWQRPQFKADAKGTDVIEIPRIAGISSFGAGGSNAHVILEEYISKNKGTAKDTKPTLTHELAFTFSAHSTTALKESVGLLKHAISTSDSSLSSIAYTLQLGREEFSHRLVVLANSRERLIDELNAFLQGKNSKHYFTGSVDASSHLTHLLGSDKDIETLINKWIETRTLYSLASTWISGVTIPWHRLYKEKELRASLPGYPFDAQRFWTAIPEKNNSASIHPLLDENRSSFDSVLYSKTYSHNSWLITSHKIFGKPTLSASAQIAMAVQCLINSRILKREEPFFLKDLNWQKLIQLTELQCIVECEFVDISNGSYLFEVGVIDSTTNSRTACLQGVVKTTDITTGNSDFKKSTPVIPRLDTMINDGYLIEKNTLNKSMNTQGYEFAGAFECFEKAYVLENCAVAYIQIPDQDYALGTEFPPATMDAVLRTSLLVGAYRKLESTSELNIQFQIPVTVNSFTVLKPFVSRQIRVYVEKIRDNQYGNTFDISVINEDNQVCISIVGFNTHLIHSDNKKTESAKQEIDSVSAISNLSKVKDWLVQHVSDTTKMNFSEIDTDTPLEKYGIDSVMIMSLNERFETHFGELSKTLFYEYQNLSALAEYFCINHADEVNNLPEIKRPLAIEHDGINNNSTYTEDSTNSRPLGSFKNLEQLKRRKSSTSKYGQKSVAVIGLSGRYPKADSINEFWENLVEGRDCIEEIPLTRWDATESYQPDAIDVGKSSSKWGGFINGHDKFDAQLFKILPDQAVKMDPQERLFLQIVWSTLEDAGYSPAVFSYRDIERSVGVFAGSMWNHYSLFGLENTIKGQDDVTFGWDASIANRASYFFDFRGPSVMVDTACSSSLLAIHQACESLLRGECKYAVAGGVNLSVHPYKYSTLTQMQMLSSDGRCRSFGDGGDGYVPGEGVGAVLLKPLDEAIADGDHIYGVIKGSSVNHNGKTNGFTVPNPVAQKHGLKLALKEAGFNAKDISYVEAHGTGTRLGDPIEFHALSSLFESENSLENSCALGSVKSNVGHLEGAAGIVALTKILLQLKHKKLVASLHSNRLNPNLKTKNSVFYIPQNVQEWRSESEKPRRAVISSLGAGGSNAFLVVEEYESASVKRSNEREQLILISAKNLISLTTNISQLLRFIKEKDSVDFSNFAYTLQTGRLHMEHRIAFIAHDLSDCVSKLRTILQKMEQGINTITNISQYAYIGNIADRSWWPDNGNKLISLIDKPINEVLTEWLTGQIDDRIVDWSSLYNGSKPRRVSLPTYSFDEQTYWAKINDKKILSRKAITPLLDENQSNFYWQLFRKTFELDDPIVSTHKVGDNSIVAGSVLLEMALTAACHSIGFHSQNKGKNASLAVKTSNLNWKHAAVVNKDGTHVCVLLLPTGSGADFYVLPAEMIDATTVGTIATEDVEQSVFLSGSLTFEVGEPLLKRNLDLITSRMQLLTANQESIYQYYKNLGLHYGSYFKVTRSIHVGTGRALAILSENERSNAYDYKFRLISPSLFDAALRTSLIAVSDVRFTEIPSLAEWTQLLVPYSIDELRVSSSLPEKVFCLVELVDIDQEYQSYAVMDIVLMDELGNVYAEINRFKAVSPTIDFYTSKESVARVVKATDTREFNRSIDSNNLQSCVGSDDSVTIDSSEVNEADYTIVKEAVKEYIAEAFSKATGISEGSIQFDKNFDAIGVDSITIVKLNRNLDRRFTKLSKTLFFECKSLADVQIYLLRKHREDCNSLLTVFSKPEIPSLSMKNNASDGLIEKNEVVFVQSVRVSSEFDERCSVADGNCKSEEVQVLFIGNCDQLEFEAIPFCITRADIANEFKELNSAHYRVSKTQKSLRMLIDQLESNNRFPEVICLPLPSGLGLNAELQNNESESIETKRLKELLQLLLPLIQELHSLALVRKIRIIFLYESFGFNRQPEYDGLDGLARALVDVSDLMRISLVRVHKGLMASKENVTRCIVKEILSAGESSSMIEYDARGRRYQYLLKSNNSSFTCREVLPLRQGGAYFVTGGAGAIGEVMANYLSDQCVQQTCNIKLIILGRKKKNEETSLIVKNLSNRFCEVSYISIDITDVKAVGALVDGVTSTHPVRGIMHCAGVSANTSILRATIEDFYLPIAAKADGTMVLDRCTASQPLDFFILFSSITAQIGDFGAGGYSIGNAFLDNFAYKRNFLMKKAERFGRTLAIGWPLWDSIGIQKDEILVQSYLEKYGLNRISKQVGLELLEKTWGSSASHVSIYFGDEKRIREKVINTIYRQSESALQPISTVDRADKKVEIKQVKVSSVSRLAGALRRYSAVTQYNHVKELSQTYQSNDIAIIGVSGRYPNANDLEDFWKNLLNGRDCISEVPKTRWNYSKRYSTDRSDKSKVHGKWGGFIDNVDMFDASYFNISPREAELLDPQERLFLQSSLHCLDDAGYTKDSLSGNVVGVYAGVMWGLYQLFDVTDEQRRFGLPGSSFSSIANRVSYYFNFSGPSMALDTMCSSSLTALHTARLAIMNGECDYALAGGVNLSLHEKKYQLLSQGQFLSSDGRCRTFGEGGDGYVPGEGVGVVLLKKLDKAIKDGDQIYGILKGSSVNHGGRSNGFTVPNPNAQSSVIEKAIEQTGWNPETVSYIEAHGTGTALGDPIEIKGLQNAFEKYTRKRKFCAIGSVKSNIGHLESAAGMAGLTKILLQIKHRKLAPSLHSKIINSNIDFNDTAFEVCRELRDWKRPVLNDGNYSVQYPLRAGISSFGAGGANAHLLIEEYVPLVLDAKTSFKHGGKQLFIISARDEKRLNKSLKNLVDFIDCQQKNGSNSEVFINTAFTLMVGRECASERIAVVADSFSNLAKSLNSVIDGTMPKDSFRGGKQQAVTLNDALTDTQRVDLIQDFVARKDLHGLASAWCSGLSIPWQSVAQKLLSGINPKRISLPMTVLDEKSFWIDEVNDRVSLGCGSGENPLLGKNESTFYQQAYTFTFNGEEFFLADHIIGLSDLKRVLPGVAYIEMARAATEQALQNNAAVIGIENLVWATPITESHISKKITLILGEDTSGLTFEVVTDHSGKMVSHAKGVILTNENPLIDSAEVDIEKYFDGCTAYVERNEVNSYFKSVGYHDGESFTAANRISFNSHYAISELRLPDSISTTAEIFELHPSLMDAALRTCLFIGGPKTQRSTIVPFSLGKIHLYNNGSLPVECMAIAKYHSNAKIENDSLHHYNVELLSKDGKRLVYIEDFCARELGNTLSKESEGHAHLFHRVLVPASVNLHSPKDNSNRDILIVGNNASTLKSTMLKNNDSETDLARVFTICTGIDKRRGDTHKNDSNEYVLKSSTEDEFYHVLKKLEKESQLPGKIIFTFDKIDDISLLSLTEQQVNDALSHSILILAKFYKALLRLKLKSATKIICVYAQNESVNPFVLSISAFAKSMVQVDHNIKIAVVELNFKSLNFLSSIFREFSNVNFCSGMEVYIRNEERFVTGFEPLSDDLLEKDNSIGSKINNISQLNLKSGNYIITGGMGQIGKILTRHLIAKNNANIVLSGRSMLSEEIKETITKLNSYRVSSGHSNFDVTYIQCDISREDSVEKLVKKAAERYGVIDGIIHAAGVVDDRKITELEEEDLVGTLSPKVNGLCSLYSVACKMEIAHIVCFSSISSFLGDFGGGSYAYANRFMDAFASIVNKDNRPTKVISIDWPLWLEGGMQLPEEQQAFYNYTGIKPITEDQGVSTFWKVIEKDCSSIAVCAGPLEKINKTLRISSKVEKNNSLTKSIGEVLSKSVSVAVKSDKKTTESLKSEEGALLEFVLSAMGSVLKMSPSSIDRSVRFESYGMDSVLLLELNKVLSEKISDLPKTVLFEYDSVDTLFSYLKERYANILNDLFGVEHSKPASITSSLSNSIGNNLINENIGKSGEAIQTHLNSYSLNNRKIYKQRIQQKNNRIAVVGLSGAFPGSSTVNELWKNIIHGKNCLKEIPSDRWDAEKYFASDANLGAEIKSLTCSKWGGFLDRVNYFDAGFFKMSEKEAESLDPQARLMIKVAWQAVEDAAYAQKELKKIPFGVFIGVMNSDYAWIASDYYRRTGEYRGPGSFASEISNRISYILDVTGPSFTVESACTSSTLAIHLARKAIIDGECDMALAGGVNLSLHPGKYLMLDQLKVLSPDGIEKTFDAEANGLVPSEGVGAVVLKSYEKALADGDHIYGVISGSASGHSGIGPALNLPSVQALEKTVISALEESGISGEQLEYIESHGSGTNLGDPIELKALVNALRKYGDKQEYCAIGSKANFGHLESVSGICSLIKVLMAFKHNVIPPCCNIDEVTPAFDQNISPLYFPRETRSFRDRQQRRYAGINSFGLGGSNAFLVLESHEESGISEALVLSDQHSDQHALIFSAPSSSQLMSYLECFRNHLDQSSERDLKCVAYTLQKGRNHYSERLAMVVSSIEQALTKITHWVDGEYELAECYSGNPSTGKGLSNLLSGKEGKDFIDSNLKSRNLNKLCELWVCGCEISWLDLYPSGAKSCSLPGISFKEKSLTLLDVGDSDQLHRSEVKNKHSFIEAVSNEDFPTAWFSTAKRPQKEQKAKRIETIDENIVLTKTMCKSIGEIDHVVEMTSVQKSKLMQFLSKSRENSIQHVEIILNGTLNLEKLEMAWANVSATAPVLRSVFIKNRKGYFRVVLRLSNKKIFQCFVESSKIPSKHINDDKAFLDLVKNCDVPYQVILSHFDDVKGTKKTGIAWMLPEFVMHSNDAIELLRKIYLDLISKTDACDPSELQLNDNSTIMNTLDVVECENAVKDYWTTHLKEFASAKPMIDNAHVSGREERCREKLIINPRLTSKLQALTQREKIDFDVVLTAAWSVIQSRFTQSSHALFCLKGKFKCFELQEFMGSCGLYESRVPILLNTQVRSSIKEWFVQIQKILDEKRKYAHIPYETIQKWMNVDSLVCCTLSVKDASTSTCEDKYSDVPYGIDKYYINDTSDASIVVEAVLRDTEVDLSIDYASQQFQQDKISLLLQYIEVVFESFVANCNRNPAAISLMTKKEYRDRFWKTLEREDS